MKVDIRLDYYESKKCNVFREYLIVSEFGIILSLFSTLNDCFLKGVAYVTIISCMKKTEIGGKAVVLM